MVTGAAGFIGARLADQLAAGGWEVLGIDSGRSGDWSRQTRRINRWDADICDIDVDTWSEALEGVDVVFHLAAEKYNSSRSTPARVIETNVTATERLLRGAGLAGVGKTVFSSSLYAYGNLGPRPDGRGGPAPRDRVRRLKGRGENLLRVAQRDYGTAWSVARLFFVYGPHQHAEGGYPSVIVTHMRRIVAGEASLIRGDGEQQLDYVYLDDAVDALIQLAEPDANGLTVNIGTGHGVSVNELTERILEITGSDLRPISVEPDWTAGTRRVSQPRLAQQELGWRATTTLDEGCGRHGWNTGESADDLSGGSAYNEEARCPTWRRGCWPRAMSRVSASRW